MAKKTWVKVGGSWREVKNVWVRVQGSWRQFVVPTGKVSGSWKEFMQYLMEIYEYGTEHVSVVRGFFRRTGSMGEFTKNAENIFIRGASYNDDETAIVTDNMVDLTSFSKVNVEVSSTRIDGHSNVNRHLVASKMKMERSTVYDVRQTLSITVTNTRKVISMDVSHLSGDFYLRVHAGESVPLTLHRMWLS